MIVCSFYTPDYSQIVKILINSCDKFNLRYDIAEVRNIGTWCANTWYKPIIIKDMLYKYPDETVLWMDADSAFIKCPELLNNITQDLAIYWESGKKVFNISTCNVDRTKDVQPLYRSGTMLFQNNNRTLKFIDDWLALKDKCIPNGVADQYPFTYLIPNSALSIYKLPPEYCKLHGYSKDDHTTDEVIAHYGASWEMNKAFKRHRRPHPPLRKELEKINRK